MTRSHLAAADTAATSWRPGRPARRPEGTWRSGRPCDGASVGREAPGITPARVAAAHALKLAYDDCPRPAAASTAVSHVRGVFARPRPARGREAFTWAPPAGREELVVSDLPQLPSSCRRRSAPVLPVRAGPVARKRGKAAARGSCGQELSAWRRLSRFASRDLSPRSLLQQQRVRAWNRGPRGRARPSN